MVALKNARCPRRHRFAPSDGTLFGNIQSAPRSAPRVFSVRARVPPCAELRSAELLEEFWREGEEVIIHRLIAFCAYSHACVLQSARGQMMEEVDPAAPSEGAKETLDYTQICDAKTTYTLTATFGVRTFCASITDGTNAWRGEGELESRLLDERRTEGAWRAWLDADLSMPAGHMAIKTDDDFISHAKLALSSTPETAKYNRYVELSGQRLKVRARASQALCLSLVHRADLRSPPCGLSSSGLGPSMTQKTRRTSSRSRRTSSFTLSILLDPSSAPSSPSCTSRPPSWTKLGSTSAPRWNS